LVSSAKIAVLAPIAIPIAPQAQGRRWLTKWRFTKRGVSHSPAKIPFLPSLHVPHFYVIDPHGGGNEKAEPAFHGMCEAFGPVPGYESTIDAKAHLVALGDEDEFMPFRVGLPVFADLLGGEELLEAHGDFLLRCDSSVAALSILKVHDARFLIDQGDFSRGQDGVAEMTGMDALEFTINESELETFPLILSRKAEAHHDTTVSETSLVVNVGGMTGLFRGACDFHDALVEIDLPNLGDAICGSTVPAVADGPGEIAVLFALKGIVKKKGPLFEPGFVIAAGDANRAYKGKDEQRSEDGIFHRIYRVSSIISGNFVTAIP